MNEPLHFLCSACLYVLLVMFLMAVCFAVQEGIIRLRRLHQIPCSRCAFFTGDYRLKCTVHPCRALSEEAINCLDYEPIASPIAASPPIYLRVSPSKKQSQSGISSSAGTLSS